MRIYIFPPPTRSDMRVEKGTTFIERPGHSSAMRFGAKAALSDAKIMAGLEVDLLEVHLRPEDLPRYRDALVRTFSELRSEGDLDLVVHAPEFMLALGSPILVDLSSPGGTVHAMSVAALEATIAFARDVGASLIVTHPGGILPSGDDPAAKGGVERLRDTLHDLRDLSHGSGIKLSVENMPWFYHMKIVEGEGPHRWASTILVGPDDLDPLVDAVDGMTLDVSHGFLHSPKGGMEIIEAFIARHRDRVLHLHLSDAMPPDIEGLQIGEGAVDFHRVLSAFKGRDVSAVPEILGGHRSGGLSFRRALEELRRIEGEV